MNSILIVDDNVHLIALLGKMLAPIGQITFATSGPAALAQMRERAPDLVLLDAQMPAMSGYAVCEAMKSDPELDRIPVIFVTAHNDVAAEVQGLAAGAVDFISKPFNEAILLARARTQLRLKCLSDELRRRAAVDGLTGLDNRASFDQRLQLEWARAVRSGAPLSLVLLDVDHFKKYNDRYGHPAGDGCLRQVAGALGAQARRPADVAARVGGEEFALLLPDTDAAGARDTAERIRSAVARLGIAHEASATAAHVTVSIGVATCRPGPACTAEDLMKHADQALYAAKAQGRDRVSVEPAPAALIAAGT
ncbi:diguanylate cyclase domain-containing protein [Roseateles sp.]|uniref:diguanylate cyclase domain-containing protein n=1 Tax=Roseateles sp. TaxID=1971397 RepID=UPI003BABCF40